MLRLGPDLVLVEVQWDLQCYSSKYHLSGVRVVLISFKSLEFSWNIRFLSRLYLATLGSCLNSRDDLRLIVED